MKFISSIILLIIHGWVQLSEASSVNDNEIKGNWTYCDGFTFKFLQLNDDQKFFWHYNSCRGDYELEGSYTQKGDTLFLKSKNPDSQLKFLRKGKQLLSYSKSTNTFSQFQSLHLSNKKTLRGAYQKFKWKKRRRRYKL